MDKKTSVHEDIPLFKQLEKQHPFLLMLYFAMVGSGMLFLFLLVGFTKSLIKVDENLLLLPKAFVISTLLILLSSYFVQKAWQNFLTDEAKSLRQNLLYLLILGFCFSISQVWGWSDLTKQGIGFSGKAAGSYLYVLTGLHILHLLGGLAFVIAQIANYNKACNDGVQALIMFSNKYEKMKMKMLKDYWHFLDVLWIIIFLYLVFKI
ncbi:MAG: cytochrome c oxidase subunit 3 [Thermoflexibacter sp.]|jgi:cytochrome c oxidase subunit 3|nr:cytochrome c oxidase subunit 3 [Thermoflexibacter sp.]